MAENNSTRREREYRKSVAAAKKLVDRAQKKVDEARGKLAAAEKAYYDAHDALARAHRSKDGTPDGELKALTKASKTVEARDRDLTSALRNLDRDRAKADQMRRRHMN